jgi:predicted MFS family arabinose efflux permease
MWSSVLLAGVIAALVSLIAYLVYAGLVGKPDKGQSKAAIFIGMTIATFFVGALAMAIANVSGLSHVACDSLDPRP